MKYKLGIEAKDVVTGVKGVLSGYAKYITGCDQYLIQPQGNGKTYPTSSWVDEGRLKILNKGKVLIKFEDVKSDEGDGCDSNQAPAK